MSARIVASISDRRRRSETAATAECANIYVARYSRSPLSTSHCPLGVLHVTQEETENNRKENCRQSSERQALKRPHPSCGASGFVPPARATIQLEGGSRGTRLPGRGPRQICQPATEPYQGSPRPTNRPRKSPPPTPTRAACGECRIPTFGKHGASRSCRRPWPSIMY